MPPPLPGSNLRLGVGEVASLVDGAGNGQSGEPRVLPSKRVDRHADEFVHVADVVGEEDELLEMLWRSAGVVPQPGKAEVGAGAVEQRQRAAGPVAGDPNA